MNQILTDEEIGCIGHDVVTNAHTLDYFARAIEQAILNKLNSAEPVAWYSPNEDHSDEAFMWDKDTSGDHLIPVFTHPPAPISVTCQIYGHVVGACDECNTHAENDVNETNKILADNYLKLTCGNPAPSAVEMQELIDQLNEPNIHFPGNFDTPKQANALLMCLCQEAANALESQSTEIAKYKALCDQMGEALINLEGVSSVITTDEWLPIYEALEAWRSMK